MRLAYTLSKEALAIGFWPAKNHFFEARLERSPQDSTVYDLVLNRYDDRLSPKDDAYHPSRAFFFFLVYIVVHRLKGTIVAIKNERAGYVLAGRPPRAVRNKEYYGHAFRLDREGAHKHLYIESMSNKEYLALAKRCYGWTYDDWGGSFRMMNE